MKVQSQFFAIFFVLFISNGALGSAQKPIMSFSDWKKEKVDTAKGQISSTKNKIQRAQNQNKSNKGLKTKDPQLMAVQQQLNQQEFNLEVAEDLGVVDYIVLYLAAQKNQNSLMKEAATKMKPEEVAQVLEAYLKVIQSQQFDKNNLKLPRHSTDSD